MKIKTDDFKVKLQEQIPAVIVAAFIIGIAVGIALWGIGDTSIDFEPENTSEPLPNNNTTGEEINETAVVGTEATAEYIPGNETSENSTSNTSDTS